MVPNKPIKGDIVTTGHENPLAVADDLPTGASAAAGSPPKQKIRASEVVIIILLVLLVVCCCCVAVLGVGVIRWVWLALGSLFSGVRLPTPFVY